MKVKEFLAHLGNLPEEVLDQEIVLIVDGSTHLTSPSFGCAAEPFYWNCDYGLVDETTAKKHIAEVEPEFELSMDDFEMAYPKHTVFLHAFIPPTEPREKTKDELVFETIREGNIPHLRIERE